MGVVLQGGGGMFAGDAVARGTGARDHAPALPVAVTLDRVIRPVLPAHLIEAETHYADARIGSIHSLGQGR